MHIKKKITSPRTRNNKNQPDLDGNYGTLPKKIIILNIVTFTIDQSNNEA